MLQNLLLTLAVLQYLSPHLTAIIHLTYTYIMDFMFIADSCAFSDLFKLWLTGFARITKYGWKDNLMECATVSVSFLTTNGTTNNLSFQPQVIRNVKNNFCSQSTRSVFVLCQNHQKPSPIYHRSTLQPTQKRKVFLHYFTSVVLG